MNGIVNKMEIDSLGIWFCHNGDEVCYIFPWRRTKFNRRFLSLGFEDCFSSLREIDDTWEGYFDSLYWDGSDEYFGDGEWRL